MLVYSGICAFMPKEFKVTRFVVINAPINMVFEEVNNFNNMQHWSPWKDYDPDMMTKVEGKPGDTIYKYVWSSKMDKVGHGSLTRKQVEKDKTVSNDLLFADYNMHSAVDWSFETMPEGIKAIWTNSGTLPFFTRIMGSKLESLMAPDIEKGLQLLKIYCEAQPLPLAYSIKIESTIVQPFNYMAIRDTADLNTISAKLGSLFGEVMAAMTKQGMQQSASPFAIYYNTSPANLDFEAAIPVDKVGKNDSGVRYGTQNTCNAVLAHYFGGYSHLIKAHEAIKQWLELNNMTATGSPWEMYVTDPGLEKDTAKWQTDVYYPIE